MLIVHLHVIFTKLSIQILCLLLNWVVSLLLSYKKSSFYILDTYIYYHCIIIRLWSANIFSYSVGCLFTFLIVSFDKRKCLILMEVSILFFSLDACAFDVIPKKSLPNLWSRKCTSVSKDFIVLAHICLRSILN